MRGHEGKVAVVTGAASGIGRAYAVKLAEEGADVVVADIADGAEAVAEIEALGRRALYQQCDVGSPEAIRELVAAVRAGLGGCDILINNAGITPVAAFEQIALDEWRRVFAVNVEAMFLLAQAFVPEMRARGWGRIVNQASGTVKAVVPNLAHYIASKGAVIGLTRALATEVAPYGITVNAIATSLIRTPGTEQRSPTPSGLPQEEEYELVAQSQAIKRVSEPHDLVGAVAFLTSDEAAFMTAQTLYVDGGTVRT